MTVKIRKLEQLRFLYQQGLSVSAMSRELRISEPTVRKYLKKMGYYTFSNHRFNIDQSVYSWDGQLQQINSVMNVPSPYSNRIKNFQSESFNIENQRLQRQNEELKQERDRYREESRKVGRENQVLNQRLDETTRSLEKINLEHKQVMEEVGIQKKKLQEHNRYDLPELEVHKKLNERLINSIEKLKQEYEQLKHQNEDYKFENSKLKIANNDLRDLNKIIQNALAKCITQLS